MGRNHQYPVKGELFDILKIGVELKKSTNSFVLGLRSFRAQIYFQSLQWTLSIALRFNPYGVLYSFSSFGMIPLYLNKLLKKALGK